MYTQVIESLPVLTLHHPNPPLAKELRGVNSRSVLDCQDVCTPLPRGEACAISLRGSVPEVLAMPKALCGSLLIHITPKWM